jgi:hypothetical protein
MIPTIEQIEIYKKEQVFLNETFLQVNKDFERVGIDMEEQTSQDWSFESLIQLVFPIVNRQLECHSEQIFSLFYLIDIPEKAIRLALDDQRENGVSHAITKLIIERELLKVLTRAYFSSQL